MNQLEMNDEHNPAISEDHARNEDHDVEYHARNEDRDVEDHAIEMNNAEKQSEFQCSTYVLCF